jgi:putative mycofactocin binding protein MftB
MTITLDSACELHPDVALRPEPFGALAYHYGNRRLIFLKHPDVVAVVRDAANHETLRAALVQNGIVESRWPSFVSALASLAESEVIRVH